MKKNKVLRWLYKNFGFNALWLMTIIPIIFIAETFQYVQSFAEILTNFILLIPLIALLLFPSSTALISAIKYNKENTEKIRIIKPFFKSYKKYYLTSLKGGILFSILGVASLASLLYFTLLDYLVLSFLFFSLLVLVSLISIHYITLIPFVETSFTNLLKESFSLVFKELKTSFLILSAMIILSLISFLFFNVLLVTYYGSIVGLLCYRLIGKNIKAKTIRLNE